MYAWIDVVTCIVMVLLIIRTRRIRNRHAAAVRHILHNGMLGVIANIFIVLSLNARVTEVAYICFFAATDWLLFRLLQYSIDYCNLHVPEVDRGIKVSRFLVYIDAIILTQSLFTHNVITIVPDQLADGELLYVFDQGAFYHVHLVMCYILCAAILTAILYKSLNSPRVYFAKYVPFFVSLLICIIWDAAYTIGDLQINQSIIGYSIASANLYFFSLKYTPTSVRDQIASKIMGGLGQGIIFVDHDNNCVYANHFSGEMFHQEESDPQEVLTSLQKMIAENQEKEGVHFYQNPDKEGQLFNYCKDGNPLKLQVSYEKMLDDKKRYIGGIYRIVDCTMEIAELEEQRYLADHDPMTGLYNRKGFDREARRLLDQNPDEEFVLICSNIVNFKLVNDVLGESTGNDVLAEIARMVEMTAPEGTVYGHLGGDKFAIMCPKRLSQVDNFEKDTKLNVPNQRQEDVKLTYHMGIYEVKNRDLTIAQMCDRAILAANSLPMITKHPVAVYDDSIRLKALREQQMDHDLDQAIARGDIRIFIQPQVTASGQVKGGEALVRWIDSEKGMLSPADFIPILEKNGSIVRMDRYIWELACMKLAEWKDAGYTDRYLSVNISTVDFLLLDVYETFKNLIRKYDLEPHNLHLEITETSLIKNLDVQLDLIKKLQAEGFLIEMDDFGSGYSSLNMLLDIPFDVLKIDMGFLRNETEKSRRILELIINLSNVLELPVITEGVETQEQVDYLKKRRSDMTFQGYYFARPMPVEEFEKSYLICEEQVI